MTFKSVEWCEHCDAPREKCDNCPTEIQDDMIFDLEYLNMTKVEINVNEFNYVYGLAIDGIHPLEYRYKKCGTGEHQWRFFLWGRPIEDQIDRYELQVYIERLEAYNALITA